jgi:hypothetical protein
VITIDLICEVCGTSNPPGTEFCTNCNSYLAWDRSVLAKPSGQPSKPAAPPSNQSTQPTQSESSCGPAPGTGFIVLNLATPTRIRLIQIAPGLADSNPQRKLQPLPKVIGIAFDNGACHSETLTATPGQQEIKIDSGKPVTRVMIGIGSAYPAPNGQPLISITEVILKAYPS